VSIPRSPFLRGRRFVDLGGRRYVTVAGLPPAWRAWFLARWIVRLARRARAFGE
jgi:hypothetical protein